MIRRCEHPRRYTELCNRSSSSVLRSAPAQMYNPDAHEDYWEDASVSLRSRHSWEAPSSGWLDASPPHLRSDVQNAESKSSSDSVPRHVRPRGYSFDSSDYLGSVKGRRCFPPPLASSSTLSIKGGGRFVLKEMDADRPQGFFRAQRENGRLLLRLVLPDESNDDLIAEDDCSDETDDDGDDEDDSSVVECSVESRAVLCDQVVHVEYGVHDGSRDPSDCISSDDEVLRIKGFDGSAEQVTVKECDHAYQTPICECEAVDNATTQCDGFQDVGSKNAEVKAHSTWHNVSKEAGSWDLPDGGYHSSVDAGQLVAESRFGIEQRDVLGHQHQECLWNVDAANHAMASRSPWSSNQMCLHQPLINMRSALGLAIS